MRGIRVVLGVVALAGATAGTVHMAGGGIAPTGEGGIIVVDQAPLYPTERSMEPRRVLQRGEPLVAGTGGLIGKNTWQFETVFDRALVIGIGDEGGQFVGWVEMKSLRRFTFEGNCDTLGSPFMTRGLRTYWNPCFTAALRDLAQPERARAGR